MNDLKMLESYFNLMCMNGGSHVFHAARQVGIFSHLTAPITLEELTKVLDRPARPLKLLLNALKALDVVVQNGESYQAASLMKLLGGTYSSLGDQYWQHLSEFLTTDAPMARMDSEAESAQHYVTQVKGLHWMMLPSAKVAAGKLNAMGILRGRLLDAGAGSAVWSTCMLQAQPDLVVTALDWPPVLEVTHAFVEAAGLTEKYSFIPGDYHSCELGKHDCIVAANIAHLEPPQQLSALLERLLDALDNAGHIILVDVFAEQEEGRLQTALYELGLALRTEYGQLYERAILEQILDALGCETQFETLETPPFTMGMMIARRRT